MKGKGKKCVYLITTETGDEPGAGTSANPYIILCGRAGAHSGQLVLGTGNSNFLPGRTDTCRVQYNGQLVSPLEAVTVGHDNAGPSPGWYLRQVGCAVATAIYLQIRVSVGGRRNNMQRCVASSPALLSVSARCVC